MKEPLSRGRHARLRGICSAIVAASLLAGCSGGVTGSPHVELSDGAMVRSTSGDAAQAPNGPSDGGSSGNSSSNPDSDTDSDFDSDFDSDTNGHDDVPGGNTDGERDSDDDTGQDPGMDEDSPVPAGGSYAASSGLNTEHLALPENVSTTWDVETQEDAVIVDYNLADAALVDYDVDAGQWTFDTATIAAANLEEGEALLVAGRGMGRIESITTNGGTTVVQTGKASLADIIESGTMAWDAELGYGADWVVDAESPEGFRSPRLAGIYTVDAAGVRHPAAAEIGPDGIRWEFESANGTLFIFKVTPGHTQSSVAIQVQRSGMLFTAKGTVGALQSSGTTVYQDGEVASSTVKQGGLSGNLKLSIASAGAGKYPIQLKVPVPLLTYIIPVGPVPVTVEIGAQVIGSIKTGPRGSAMFEASFSYSGDAGFTFDGTDSKAFGTLTGMSMDPQAADSAAMIGVPVNAEFGIAYPRVAISIFKTGIIPYIQAGIVLGTSLHWGPVCKEAYVRGELTAGYSLEALGVKFHEDKVVLWKDKRETAADSCP